MNYIKNLFNYSFKGRASRKEFWLFWLFYIVGFFMAGLIDVILGTTIYINGIKFPVLMMIYSIATLIPTFTVAVRRLHDINKSAWWILLQIIPPVYIIYVCIKGTDGDNKYGANPLKANDKK